MLDPRASAISPRRFIQSNSSGRVLTIFLVIIAVLLVSLTALSVFFWQKEMEVRKESETELAAAEQRQEQLEGELKDLKKENFLLTDKNKALDDRINSLLDELELAEGIRDEMRNEINDLKRKTDLAQKEKDDIRAQVADEIASAEQKIARLETQLENEKRNNERFVDLNNELQTRVADLQSKLKEAEKMSQLKPKTSIDEQAQKQASSNPVEQMPAPEKTEPAKISNETAPPKLALPRDRSFDTGPVVAEAGAEVELPPIVVNPKRAYESVYDVTEEQRAEDQRRMSEVRAEPMDLPSGRILSIDNETEFVIISLGEKDGVSSGRLMSVYRGENYLGDIKITRVQPEMAAADFVPPFSSQIVRKNDQVVPK